MDIEVLVQSWCTSGRSCCSCCSAIETVANLLWYKSWAEGLLSLPEYAVAGSTVWQKVNCWLLCLQLAGLPSRLPLYRKAKRKHELCESVLPLAFSQFLDEFHAAVCLGPCPSGRCNCASAAYLENRNKGESCGLFQPLLPSLPAVRDYWDGQSLLGINCLYLTEFINSAETRS